MSLEKEPAGAFNKAQRLIEYSQHIYLFSVVAMGAAKLNPGGMFLWRLSPAVLRRCKPAVGSAAANQATCCGKFELDRVAFTTVKLEKQVPRDLAAVVLRPHRYRQRRNDQIENVAQEQEFFG